jgi:hypothetical protein
VLGKGGKKVRRASVLVALMLLLAGVVATAAFAKVLTGNNHDNHSSSLPETTL